LFFLCTPSMGVIYVNFHVLVDWSRYLDKSGFTCTCIERHAGCKPVIARH